MKIFIALFAVALAVVAAEPSYVTSVLPQAVSVPVSTSVWPPYGVYGKGLAQRYAPVASYPGYSAGVYGGLPVYDNAWGYSTPVLGAYGNAKLIDNGLWNYGGYGYGHTNMYWL
ncbi:uncharacterized protein LOC119766458 [Culex quinquefasciatus]|uniref:uncharacterized protein LOC119766458 n=1 Tax=Culex quinquefasciatus TaxID=7176 RepID=UPI0018E3A654|nr:uncharacterized protein LOC119766458 [Culex quinquefasciatus]